MEILLGFAALAAIVVAPMAAVFYGYLALRWGLDRYPRATRLVVVLLIALPFVAAMTFGKLFPGCYGIHVGMMTVPMGDCRPH